MLDVRYGTLGPLQQTPPRRLMKPLVITSGLLLPEVLASTGAWPLFLSVRDQATTQPPLCYLGHDMLLVIKKGIFVVVLVDMNGDAVCRSEIILSL